MASMGKIALLGVAIILSAEAQGEWATLKSQRMAPVVRTSDYWPLLFTCVNPAPHSHTVHALDSESGQSNWNVTVRSMSNGPCTYASDKDKASIVCLQMWDKDDKPNRRVEAYSIKDGTLQWNISAPDSCSFGFLAGFEAERSFYMLCSESEMSMTLSRVLKVDTTDGHVEWVFNFSQPNASQPLELGPVYQFGNSLYVAADTGNFTPVTALGGFLHAVHPEDGKVTWTYNAVAPVVGLISADNGSVLIAATMDNHLHGIRSSDGKQLWRVNSSEPSDPKKFFPHTLFGSTGAPALSMNGELVYIYGQDGLHAFSVSNGELKWSDKDSLGCSDNCPFNRPLLGKSSKGEIIYSLANDTHKPRPYPAGADPDLLALSTNDAHHQWRSHPGFEGPCPSLWSISDDGEAMFAQVELGNFYMHAMYTSNGTNKWEFKCPELQASVTMV